MLTSNFLSSSLSAPIPIPMATPNNPSHHHINYLSPHSDLINYPSSSSSSTSEFRNRLVDAEIARSANSAFAFFSPHLTPEGFCMISLFPHGHSSGDNSAKSSPQKKSRSVDDEISRGDLFLLDGRKSPSHHQATNSDSNTDPVVPTQQPSPCKSSSEILQHTASDRDTLTSIAARYDVTPSEIIKLNRLATRLIFPGQVVKVPVNKKKMAAQQQSEDPEVFSEEKVQRKFVKLNVRHVTDGNGVVSGTLLVTPNAVMFDPNVSDPLVLDQGAETYGVILPLDVVVHAGIFSDIAHMKVLGKSETYDCGPLPYLYPNTSQRVSAAATPHPPPQLLQSSRQQHSGSSPSNKEKVLKRLSFPLTWMESLGSTAAASDVASSEQAKSAPPTGNDEGSFHYESSSTAESDHQHPLTTSEVEEKPSSGDMTWYLCLSTGHPKEWRTAPSRIRAAGGPGLIVSYGVKNRVYPEYWFHIIDDAEHKHVEEIYRFWMTWWPHTYSQHVDKQLLASRGYEATEWETLDSLVEILGDGRGGRYGGGAGTGGSTSEDQPGGSSAHSKESWEMLKSPFGGPKQLSSYLLTRSQTLLTSTSSSATTFGQGILDSLSDFTSLDFQTNPEVVSSMSDELRMALYANEAHLPDLIGDSEIFNEEHDEQRRELARNLTARADGYPWTLLFSSSEDGFSLSTLYRKMPLEGETPLLLVIEDVGGNVFGALLSSVLRPSDVFYGTGQSFLFNLSPEFHVWRWTGENMYFVRGGLDSGIFIGAGDGKFGLWLDSDLNRGRSEECSTYGNPPLVETEDFVIKTLECWGFLEGINNSSTSQMKNCSDDTTTGGGGLLLGVGEGGVVVTEET